MVFQTLFYYLFHIISDCLFDCLLLICILLATLDFIYFILFFILFYCILCESLLYLISISFIFIACFHFYFARSIWNEKNFPPGINKVF